MADSQIQNKEFDKESREAIKAVFTKFDKDQSGELDYNELKLVAQELGVQLETNEIQKIFQELDENKDKKISFEEFWEWWKSGRPNKLEKMIYFKLKSMKLLKKAHADFVRIGGSLDVKYNSNIDHFYAALNYGSHPGDTRVQVKVNLNNVEGEDLIRETLEGFKRNENEQDHQEIVAFVIRVKSNKPEEAATKIKFLIDSLRNMLLQVAGSMQTPEFNKIINLVKIAVEHYKHDVIIKFSFPPDIIQGFLGDDPVVNQITGIYSQMFYETNLSLSFTAGIKNSLKKISQNYDQKFVDWLFEGFLFELNLTCNRSLIEQISLGLIQAFQFQLQIFKYQLENNEISQADYDQKAKGISKLMYLYLLRSAKFHLVFKDIDDVNNFFVGMGLEDLTRNQPSCKELLEEIKLEQDSFSFMKDEQSHWNIIYKFLQCFQENCEGQISFSIIYKKTIIQLILSIEGIGEIFDYLMK